jgi:hypothetical protein
MHPSLSGSNSTIPIELPPESAPECPRNLRASARLWSELSKEKRSFAMLLIPRIAVIALKMARDQVRLAETENRAKKKLISITTETST